MFTFSAFTLDPAGASDGVERGSAGRPAGHTGSVNEALTLFATLVSAIAAAIGTAVSVAQWKRSAAPGTPAASGVAPSAAPPLPRVGGPVRPRPVERTTARVLARTAAIALILGAVTAGFATLGEIVYWVQQAADDGTAWESLLDVALAGGLLAGVVGAALAVFVVVAGLAKRSGRSVWLGVLAFALSMTIWVAFWLTDLIKDLSRG
jgi:hypothetical protein